MTTLGIYHPAAHPTPRIAPAQAEVGDLVIGLPRVDTPEEAHGYGWCLGREGLDLWTEPFALDLVDPIRDGYAAGQDDRLRAACRDDRDDDEADTALLDSAPTDAEIAEGVAPWAERPSPEELAAGLRAILRRIDGEDAIAEFARLALESVARDVELFEARSFPEVQARDFEMARTAFACRECGGGAW